MGRARRLFDLAVHHLKPDPGMPPVHRLIGGRMEFARQFLALTIV